MSKLIKVLCVTDYFLPGYLGGGPITTINNMRQQLKGKVMLSVLTRDRDLGVYFKYPEVISDQWNETDDGPIYYASPENFGLKALRRIMRLEKFDIIYFNSFFSAKASVILYAYLKIIKYKGKVLLAPRGEFSLGALAIKNKKKFFYLRLCRHLKVYKNIFWHALTEKERNDILRVFPKCEDRIYIAPDPVASNTHSHLKTRKKTGSLKIVFISRISPKKNLDGLLRTLAVYPLSSSLDIYGPVEDVDYWELCEQLIKDLPESIQVHYHGPISPSLVQSTFAEYDLFTFPTHGENFGHVIFESLLAGTPIIISEHTPWQPNLSEAVTVVPLNDTQGWGKALEKAWNRSKEEQLIVKYAAQNYAQHYLSNMAGYKESLKLFEDTLNA